MTELTHLRPFLGELASLEAEDTQQMPLTVLVNLCRGRMRQPLLGVKLLASDRYDSDAQRAIEAEGVLDERYPLMSEARLVQSHLSDSGIYGAQIDQLNLDREELDAAIEELSKLDPIAWELVVYTADGWSSTEVAVRLYEMTCGTHARSTLAPLVDAMLGLDPVVGQMLLDLAALSPKEG